MRCLANEGNAIARGLCRHETREREDAARPDLADGPEQTLEARLERRAKSGVVERCEASRDCGTVDPHEARGVAGRRDDGQRTGGAVELRRDAVVRPLMRERAGERALLVAPLARFDARGGPAERLAAVGADDKARVQTRAIRETQLGRRRADVERVGGGFENRDRIALGGLAAQCLREDRVGDVAAESVEPDLGGA